jgi:hypothetical protein
MMESHIVLEKNVFLLLTSAFEDYQHGAQNCEDDDADDEDIDDGVCWQDEDLYRPSRSGQKYDFDFSAPEKTASWLLGMMGDHDLALPNLPIVNYST